MKNLVFLFLIGSFGVRAQYNAQNLKLDRADAKYKYEKLQFYPVRANETFVREQKDIGNYKTLKEAVEKNKITIKEVESGAVNTLLVENHSTDTIMILAGEVVLGGKQDRMVGEDIVLYPYSKKLIPVFCVEQNRWTANKGDMNFKGYYAISSTEVRKAATVKKDQREVWTKVAETTSKNDARTSTGTLTALKQSDDLNSELKKYSDHFAALLINEPDVIGVVAVSGDSVLGCDMFANHEIFKQHYTGLVNSYSTEAITNGKNVTVPEAEVAKYLNEIIVDESRQDTTIRKKGTMLKQGNKKLHISTF
jgi:hypothetical protein